LIRVTGEAVKDDRRWDAIWSYRAHPPTVGEGKDRQVVPFENWAAQLGLGIEVEEKGLTLTEEDIKKAFAKGFRKIPVVAPGMKFKEK